MSITDLKIVLKGIEAKKEDGSQVNICTECLVKMSKEKNNNILKYVRKLLNYWRKNMKDLEYVKSHIDEFELDDFLDKRWTKRFLDFVPVEEWKNYGFETRHPQSGSFPIAWTEKNILAQLEEDVRFGYEKAMNKRGISSELMAYVVRSWCRVLENSLEITDLEEAGNYWINQFTKVADYYKWELK